MTRAAILLGLFTGIASAQLVTKLSPETNAAFDSYIAANEPKLLEAARSIKPLPLVGADAMPRVRKGEIVVRGFTGDNGQEVKDGIIHDWAGGTFFAGATLAQTVAVLQDFARHKQYYPEIVDSKSDGNGTGTWVMKKKKVITVVLRADLDSHFTQVDPRHGYIVSKTKPIIEVKDWGKPSQGAYPAGEGHGFLWRFNGYWTLHQADGGVYAECRVISLTRDVPGGLGWIVNPFIRNMPRESLEATLTNTRAALRGK